MFETNAVVESVTEIGRRIFLLQAISADLADSIQPGQFINIRVSDTGTPLLRRPFSVADVEKETFSIIFNVSGKGTELMSQWKKGDLLNLLGPLGKGFSLEGNYKTAVIIAGGLGVAPFPFLTRSLKEKKSIVSFIGAATKNELVSYGLENYHFSTDDGSEGYKGTVVSLAEEHLSKYANEEVKIYACGPNAMLRAVRNAAIEKNIECELSTECAMACGFGICQGCPVESTVHPEKYSLVCKDGPVFNAKEIIL